MSVIIQTENLHHRDPDEEEDSLKGVDLSIEKGSRTHDDAPDADEGAIYILQKHTRKREYQPSIGFRRSPKNMW